MKSLSQLFRRGRGTESRFMRRVRSRKTRPNPLRAGDRPFEMLENRSMLAVDVTFGGGDIEILYGQPDVNGVVETSNQHVTVEIEDIFDLPDDPITRVNIYVSSNPLLPGAPPPPAAVQTFVFVGVGRITAIVPNPGDAGVNNNSLTIKGIGSTPDRIIMAGSGDTAAGRWSDETDEEEQVLIETQGIDDLTLTAGGIINVSGAFTNDTGDASITVVATVPENATPQLTGLAVVAEATPVSGDLPQPRLFSNFVSITAAQLDILSDIVATDHVILRAGDNTPGGARSNLVLPYDITLAGSQATGGTGRLELYSTQNIEQLPGSTIIASQLVAVSNNADVAALGGPWMISLGTETNDFDSISLGMTSTPGDAVSGQTEGKIAVRDIDDVVVSDFGILASTGTVRLDVNGPLTINAPIQATGVVLESDDSVSSLIGAVMRLGDQGITVLSNATFANTSTGDVTLRGPITLIDTDPTALVQSKIVSTAGAVTLSGGLYAPHGGSTTISGQTGVVIGGAIQVGATKIDANSNNVVYYDHDLTLTSQAGGVTIGNVPGNDAIPHAVQATNIIAIDAVDNISIEGSVFAGSIYGDPANLTANEALPAISIRGLAEVTVSTTGSLRTQAYETDPNGTANPLVGKISIMDAARVQVDGPITADGAVYVQVPGDIYAMASVTGRETVTLRSMTGSVDVQGAVLSTGGAYDAIPTAGSQREPNVILDASMGTVSTSGAGTLTAGTVSVPGANPAYGTVSLNALNDIIVGADIDNPGSVVLRSKIGAVEIDSLVRTINSGANTNAGVTISAGNGVRLVPAADGGFGRLAGRLDVTNTNALSASAVTDIDLQNSNNAITSLTVRNMSVGGKTSILNGAESVAVEPVETNGDFTLKNTGSISVRGIVHAATGSVDVQSITSGINVSASISADAGGVAIEAAGEIVQRGGSVVQLFLISGGKEYTYANINIEPPPGAGLPALATATITPYPSPPGDGVEGYISALNLLDPGWGYFSGQRVAIEIDGDGEGAQAVGVASVVSSSIEGATGVTIRGREGVTLVNAVRSSGGNVQIEAARGDIGVQNVSALQGSAAVNSERGLVIVESIAAKEGLTIDADQGVQIRDSANASDGSVRITTVNGDVDLRSNVTVIGAQNGSVTLASTNGTVLTPPVINATEGVSITGFGNLTLNNAITTSRGDVTVTSTSGGLTLNADLTAHESGIKLQGKRDLVVAELGGVTSVLVVDPGFGYSDATFVTFARPANPPVGVVAYPAYGRPVIVNGEITQIIIVSPGVGYFEGEQVAITITDPDQNSPGEGAIAVGFASRPQQSIIADNGVSLDFGGSILLTGQVRDTMGGIDISAVKDVTFQDAISSVQGDISITSVNGDVIAIAPNAIISTQAGGVALESINGAIVVPQVFNVRGDLSLRSYAGQVIDQSLTSSSGSVTVASTNGAVAINANVIADAGDVTIASTSDAISLTANLFANDRATLTAKAGISQNGGWAQGAELVVRNSSNSLVNLVAPANDFENVALYNLGDTSYSDANDFETGVERTGGVLPVEIVGNAVTLASRAADSIVRVVSGLKYRTLSIVAGNVGGAGIGTVEYVTTASGDNPPTVPGVSQPFAGTLRDMIRYANDNTGSYDISGSRKPQPQAMVFNEDGYDVTDITVGATSLPVITKPVTFDGGMLTDAVLAADPAARLGLTGASTTPAGLIFGIGSNESQVTRLAVGGFAGGSGIVLTGGKTTITNVWAGLDRNGNPSANRAGIEINGAAAVGNVVGSVVVDPTVANRIMHNKAAGVLLRLGASNNLVHGNYISENGDGIRINGAIGTTVGAADATQPDLQPSTSNTIVANRGSGIQIINSNAGSYGTANRVRNNRIEDNATGISVTGSKFAIIGASGVDDTNVIVNQRGSGIAVAGSSDLRIRGNEIGVDAFAAAPNLGDGIAISASSRVDVSNRNRISGNVGNGISVAAASTAVTIAGNTIGEDGLGNGIDGVAIRASIGNTIGQGNVVAYNGRHGVSVSDARASGVSVGNRVFGSLIGNNAMSGVLVSGGSYSTIGGTKAGEANEIQSNGGSGITVVWNPSTGSPVGHQILANLVGTNRNREVIPLGNGGEGIKVTGGTGVVVSDANAVMNNAGDGVVVEGGRGNVVGALTPSAANVISDNAGSGVRVKAAVLAGMPAALRNATSHVIRGNVISTNGGNGVSVTGPGTSGIVIGDGVTATGVTGLGNAIADNAGFGVSLGSQVKQVSFQGNSVYGNALGAFNLASAANPLRATSLTLTSAVVRGTGSSTVLTINGSGRGPANQQYSVDIYANSPDDGDYDQTSDPQLNSTGYQARRLLGRVTVTAGADGTFSLRNVRITAAVEVGEVITMAATSLRFNAGSTSALSTINVTADLPGIVTPRPPY
jgi:hypothetical protein